MTDYYIGLISGTSMDGIDAALVAFGDHSVDIAAANTYAYPPKLRKQLIAIARQPESCTADVLGTLDHWVGECFRDAALALIGDTEQDVRSIRAIGSHGQTVRHRPDKDRPFTLQIGNASIIAKGTGLTCVADFRSADIALGGQGAPLAPPFHEWLFRRDNTDRCVLNIGGIANVTVLPSGRGGISGFDTGPGNTLLDAWSRSHRNTPYDDRGQWAASGKTDERLLKRMLADPYFLKPPPKSTGFEYFNDVWLGSHVNEEHLAADVQSTLCDLTARSVASAIESHAPRTTEVLVCGGGVHNDELLTRLDTELSRVAVTSTGAHGLNPDWVEASAFAWLAMRSVQDRPGNAPGVTGASREAVLGAIHPAG